MSKGIELLRAARILKSNGTDGEILASFRAIAPEDIDVQGPVFICRDGLPVPFFIEQITLRGKDRALIHFTGVDSLEDAEELSGADICVNASDYEPEEEDDLSALTGWTLFDQDGKKVGLITDYEDIPGNPCLYADTENGQVMIPLHEDFILSADSEKRELVMQIPEGLL